VKTKRSICNVSELMRGKGLKNEKFEIISRK